MRQVARMLTAADEGILVGYRVLICDRDTKWSAFGSDPEFRALVAKPELSDAAIVSSISNVFLRPTAYSQI